MASFLVRLWRDVLGNECPDGESSGFTDIAGTTHEANIECLFGLGITKGKTAETYAPEDSLKSAHISLFLLRTWETAGNGCPRRESELQRAADCLLELRVVPSVSEASSDLPVTRAQMAVYLIGLWRNLVGAGSPPEPPGRLTVVVVEEVDLPHVVGDVRVGLGLEDPVPVSGELVGTPNTTGVLYAVDDQDRLQGLAVTVKGGEGDRPISARVDYLTTAAALILTTPGIATTDPRSTIGLALLLASLEQTGTLADRLEADANRLGADYLSREKLTPETAAALGEAVDALTSLLFSSETAAELRPSTGGADDFVTASILGAGKAAASTGLQRVVSGSDGYDRVATAEADCRALEGTVPHEPTLRWMAYLHWLDDRPTTRPRDGLCLTNISFDESAGSYAVEAMNESFWVGVAVPVTETHSKTFSGITRDITYYHRDYELVPARSYNIPQDIIGAAATVVWETGTFWLKQGSDRVLCTLSEDNRAIVGVGIGLARLVPVFGATLSIINIDVDPDCEGLRSFAEAMVDYRDRIDQALEFTQDDVIEFYVTTSRTLDTQSFAIARPLGASNRYDGEGDYGAVGSTPHDVVATSRTYHAMHTLEPALLMFFDTVLDIVRPKLVEKGLYAAMGGLWPRIRLVGVLYHVTPCCSKSRSR